MRRLRAQCESCEMYRVLNRYLICEECADAFNHDMKDEDVKLKQRITSSIPLCDLIGDFDGDTDAHSITDLHSIHSDTKGWFYGWWK